MTQLIIGVEGGPIFSIAFVVVYLTPLVSKISVPHSEGRTTTFFLNEPEMDIISQLQDSALDRERSLFEDSSCLTVKNLLDEIDCSPSVKKLILVRIYRL